MPTYRISGSAVPTAVAGDVTGLEEALAGEPGVEVEQATRLDEGEVQFTLQVDAPDEATAVERAQRVADRFSPGSGVTVLGEA